MSILRHLVIATSTALVASTVLASGAVAAPAPATAATPAETTINSTLNPALIESIKASLATASISPAKTTKSLDSQISQVELALQNAEAAALEAAENLVVAGEDAARSKILPASLSGTSLAKFAVTNAEITRQQSSEISSTAQALYRRGRQEAQREAHRTYRSLGQAPQQHCRRRSRAPQEGERSQR